MERGLFIENGKHVSKLKGVGDGVDEKVLRTFEKGTSEARREFGVNKRPKAKSPGR